MTRKHFQLMADALKAQKPEAPASWAGPQWVRDVEAVADVLRSTNPRFDRARFLKACGLEG